jgi:hypothetical protein
MASKALRNRVVELMFDEPRPDLFKTLLRKSPDELPETESLEDKVLRAYLNMKKKAAERRRRKKKGNSHWEPKANDKVFARCQPVSDAVSGIARKFTRPYNGPWLITKVIPPSVYELQICKEEFVVSSIRGHSNRIYKNKD